MSHGFGCGVLLTWRFPRVRTRRPVCIALCDRGPGAHFFGLPIKLRHWHGTSTQDPNKHWTDSISAAWIVLHASSHRASLLSIETPELLHCSDPTRPVVQSGVDPGTRRNPEFAKFDSSPMKDTVACGLRIGAIRSALVDSSFHALQVAGCASYFLSQLIRYGQRHVSQLDNSGVVTEIAPMLR